MWESAVTECFVGVGSYPVKVPNEREVELIEMS